MSFLWVLPNADAIQNDISDDILAALTVELENAVYENNQLLSLLKEFSTKHNLKFGKFMQSLRMRLSGMPNGPKVGEMMEILGPKITIQRIRRGSRSNEFAKNKDYKKHNTA